MRYKIVIVSSSSRKRLDYEIMVFEWLTLNNSRNR